MAIRTKIIVQQILNIDDTTTTASKYPKYTVVLGNSISSITAGELTAAVESSAASAAAAKDSEIAAKSSETNARDSENRAAIYADSSEASATQSATSATESERQAELSKASAEESAASATEAGTHKDAAQLAAQNAERSRELAEQAKTAAQQAQVAAETAKTGAETAKEGADAAATTAGEHAAAAKQSELNAKVSETNAAGSATEAGDKAIDATAEADRAKAEADRASQVVDGKLDKVDISGFIKVYKTKAEADADVANRVLDEKILVWNQTESKYGWYKVAGTTKAPVLELVETEQKLVSINNVHADDAGNVQITLPGGNPSLWLGEVTWFPYDKDSGVGYPGVLPADGREVLRVDYPDTWEAIEAGLIPSVTETEWQAGAILYFSTGDGSTTFRLPDMMQGQAFRAPTKGEEDAGVIKDQIPYVVTVNGISPDDITGNVEIDTSLQGTVNINQGGTGATTKEDARIALELYSTTEVDSALADKADIATTYTKMEVDSALADKADIATTYTKMEVDSALADAKTQSDTNYLLKANNLSDLGDRTAAWLNVRPLGSTPLASDPVSDYDATTKRWVQNLIGAGTVGPTMNGVMNYGVGDFHLRDSRAYIQPYEVLSDGQLLNRAAWPELWAYAQMLSPISDAEWLSSAEKRGRYSTGDGSTTFRVPDRNGVQPGSTTSLFGRGDGGTSSENGRVYEAAAPNILGTFANDTSGKVWMPAPKSVTGSFGYAPTTEMTFLPNDGSFVKVNNNATTTFNARLSDEVYGKYEVKNQILPKSFVGVWVIRASGGFTAANTSWSVINADAVVPGANVTTYGGDMWSTYQVAGADYVKLGYRAKVTIDGASTGEIRLMDSRVGGTSKTWEMPTVSGTLLSSADIGTSGAKIPLLNVQNMWTKTQVFQESGVVTQSVLPSDATLNDHGGPHFVSYVITDNQIRLGAKFFSSFDSTNLRRAVVQVTTDNDASAQIFAFDQRGDISSAKGIVQWSGSDTRIKTNFEPVQSGSWERISKISICEYTYKVNPTPQRGYLAQQMREIDPLYVFEGGRSIDDNGKEFEILNVNDKAVTADLIIVVQQMQEKLAVLEEHNKKIIPLEEEIATLKDEVNTLKKLLVEINQSLAITSRVSALESEVNELKRP
ncbi:lateral tail fiber protein [Escherichia phage TrudiGerster]|uniref:Lateral tail fiber protein n=1 Tax=Escherichia phage TrudiGerster TaxID=2851991 RepID=A0AAE7W1M1_9CAUD|nr:lateral tail fiber protein [Escherichia phage TrudiGerster]